MSEDPKKPLPKNWKVSAALLRKINIECAKLVLTQPELAERVWMTYWQNRDEIAEKPE